MKFFKPEVIRKVVQGALQLEIKQTAAHLAQEVSETAGLVLVKKVYHILKNSFSCINQTWKNMIFQNGQKIKLIR